MTKKLGSLTVICAALFMFLVFISCDGDNSSAPSNHNTWTCVSGSDTLNATGVYGTKGEAHPDNMPGARDSSVSWTDSAGNFWLFGGSGLIAKYEYGKLNDLWKYDTGTGWWTWVSGSDTINSGGEYGTKGIAASGNVPGARYGSSNCTDSSGDFWLFGGVSTSNMNDLWKYDTGTGMWIWISGSNTTNEIGTYGTKGIAAIGNVPGARSSSELWTDSDDDLWLFGGVGYDSTGTQSWLNDLWKYDTGTGMWTWISGSDTITAGGVYGTKGTPDINNTPGARCGSESWTDSEGNLWLFGGIGFDSAGTKSYLNDLWKYDTGTGMWTWVSGSDTAGQTGNYSTGGIIGARSAMINWIDGEGNPWFFGGFSYNSEGVDGDLNDLWKYNM